MPSIHAEMVHIPRPPKPPPRRGDKAREAGGKAYNAAKEKFREYTQGPRKKAKHTGMNMGSSAAHNPRSGETIGDIPTRSPRFERRDLRRAVGVGAITGGAFGGEAIGNIHGRHRYPESKEFKSTALGKAWKPNLNMLNRPPRITDLGTRAEKYENRRFPEFPRKTAAAGLAGGGALGYATGTERKKSEAEYVKSVKRKKAKQAVAKDFKIKQEVPKMSRNGLAFADEGARLRHKTRYKSNYKMVGRKGKHKAENAGIEGAGLAAGGGVGAAVGHKAGKHVLADIERDAHLYTPDAVKQLKHLAPKVMVGTGIATGLLYGDIAAKGLRNARATKRTNNESYKAGDVRRPRSSYKEHANRRNVIVTKSAFGVEHGVDISKAKKKYKENKRPVGPGRVALGATVPGVHSLVAGKGAGGKARSFGTEAGGAVVGRTVGGAITRGHGGRALGFLGGGAGGTVVSHKKGWLKRQKVRPRE